MEKHLKETEKILITTLIWLVSLILVLSVVELCWIILKNIITPPVLLLDIKGLLDTLGLFLLVLIGVELLDTIRTYITEGVIHGEVVIMVALIALARKVIILDIKKVDSLSLIGIGVIILALGAAYYLVGLIIQKKKIVINRILCRKQPQVFCGCANCCEYNFFV